MAVALPRPSRLPLVIQPLRLSEQAAHSFDAGGMLLVALDPEQWPEPSGEMLSQAFGLTQTESEVAVGIASGRALAKIASDRGVKIGTVRAHLKAVFSKTHIRSQADLTRVLTRLAFLVPHANGPTVQAVPAAALEQKLKRAALRASNSASNLECIVSPLHRRRGKLRNRSANERDL
jgi:DNA-binding CsgD family transcriptional regulator